MRILDTAKLIPFGDREEQEEESGLAILLDIETLLLPFWQLV